MVLQLHMLNTRTPKVVTRKAWVMKHKKERRRGTHGSCNVKRRKRKNSKSRKKMKVDQNLGEN